MSWLLFRCWPRFPHCLMGLGKSWVSPGSYPWPFSLGLAGFLLLCFGWSFLQKGMKVSSHGVQMSFLIPSFVCHCHQSSLYIPIRLFFLTTLLAIHPSSAPESGKSSSLQECGSIEDHSDWSRVVHVILTQTKTFNPGAWKGNTPFPKKLLSP